MNAGFFNDGELLTVAVKGPRFRVYAHGVWLNNQTALSQYIELLEALREVLYPPAPADHPGEEAQPREQESE